MRFWIRMSFNHLNQAVNLNLSVNFIKAVNLTQAVKLNRGLSFQKGFLNTYIKLLRFGLSI